MATAGDVVAVREALLRLGPEVVVAESWPIELHQAWHGFRWTRNALALARSGRLPYDGRVIDCAAHRTQLWREADRPLLEAISDDLLAPLLALKPHQRLMLGLTLERWLEFNESATCLGKALGVHPHTVYNRLRELRALYGDRLDNPDDRLALRACLGLVLRQWQAEYRQRRRTRQR